MTYINDFQRVRLLQELYHRSISEPLVRHVRDNFAIDFLVQVSLCLGQDICYALGFRGTPSPCVSLQKCEEFADSGCAGIPPDISSRIFDDFEQDVTLDALIRLSMIANVGS